jgi:hypothetical protein
VVDLLRILIVVFLFMHATGHIIWFLAAWTQVTVGFKDGTWILPGDVTIRSPIGKLWGLAALVAMLLLAVGALGLAFDELWWARITNLGVWLSLVVVAPWWRQAPGSAGRTAIIADIVLMFAMALGPSIGIPAG